MRCMKLSSVNELSKELDDDVEDLEIDQKSIITYTKINNKK